MNSGNIPSWSEKGKKLQKKRWEKKRNWLIALATILWIGWWIDVTQSCVRKNSDKHKHGEIELKDDTASSYDRLSNSTVYFRDGNWEIADSLGLHGFLDELLRKNDYDISSSALLTIMTNENALKTSWLFHNFDNFLAKTWVERSGNSESLIWRLLKSVSGNWSYWRFQVQREAIENWYKKNPDRYNDICKKIANFKLPNKDGNWEELYKQLEYHSDNEMISDLKNKELPVYTWGGRLWIALWTVLLNEQLVDRNEWWEKYNENKVIRKTQNIKGKYLDSLDEKDPIRKALNREWSEWEKLKSLYILSRTDSHGWKNRISFKNIQEKLQSPEFKSWEIAAWWSTSTEARKNSEYLMDLSIAKLNQRFNDEINGNHQELSITTPTGTFWPASKDLAVKHLDLPDELKDKDPQDIKNYLNEHPEIIEKFKNKIIADYIVNFQRLFLLNGSKEEIKGWKSTRNELSERQMNFLEQNLNLSFNHLYISVQYFQDYVKERNWNTEKLDILRDNYVTNVENDGRQKEKRQNLAKILTHETEFMEATWLKKSDYEFFIKHRLWPALLWTSIILSETWNVVPEIQWQRSSTSNEKNTLYRFCSWTRAEVLRMEEAEKWIPINLNINISSKNTVNDVISKIRDVISKDENIMQYIKNNCRDHVWRPITDINQLSDNIISRFILNNEDNREALDQAYSWKTEITLYFNTMNTEQIVTNTPIIWKARRWDTFCGYIYELQDTLKQNHDYSFSQILKRIIWKDSIEKKDITKRVIRQLIRKPDWSIWEDLDELKQGDSFLIVIPLTRGTPRDIDVSKITPMIFPLGEKIQMKESVRTTQKEIWKTFNESKKRWWYRGKQNFNTGRNVLVQNSKPINSQQKYTPQKR